mgnify:CR=1 FL=1
MFKEEREESHFDWSMLGDIEEGRPNLGSKMDVSVYRLMQFTLRDIIIKEFDVKTADKIFYLAGKKAGQELYRNKITKKENLNEFIAELQDVLKELSIGILRIEKAEIDKLHFTLTVSEDLDCSGLPLCNEEICVYDEGFINGLLSEHTGVEFIVKEIDCWCSGDRVCRFDVFPADK